MQAQMAQARWLIVLISLTAATFSVQGAASAAPCEPDSAGTITYDELMVKYADADSRFAILEGKDGIRVHYKDQGSGPAILLVHSSGGDLKDWDGWVEILKRSYRVIRLDLPAFGLTGPVPSGNYSIDRYLMLVDALMDHLGIDRFAIAGTSYGGLVAFRYAGTRTDRVTALILQNSAGIEYGGHGGTIERDRNPNVVFTPKAWTTEEIEVMLKNGINDHSKITPDMVQRKTDYWNLVGRDHEAFVAQQMYERGNPERVLSHVRVPALVLWGGSGKGLSPETAQLFADALANSKSVKVIMLAGGGHLLHIERPAETAREVNIFLDSEL